MTARLAVTTFLLLVLALPRPGAAQARSDGEDERERQFVEALRREDPAAAERWLALRDVRTRALAGLHEAEAGYAAAGPELRSVALPRLTQARRAYAEASLVVLDFLDARDRRTLASYQEALASYRDAITRIGEILAERQRTRADLEKLRQNR